MDDRRNSGDWKAMRRRVIEAAAQHDLPCSMCGFPIDYSLSGRSRMGPTVDHVTPLAYGGEAVPSVDELRVVHQSCNARQGAHIANARRSTASKRKSPPKKESPNFASTLAHPAAAAEYPHETPKSPALIGRHPRWWPEELRTPPDNATMPRLETPHHSRAVGTYGTRLQAHAATYGLELRWWQFYAHCRILEHDANGDLCWPEAAASVARQVGKGYGGLRPLAEWRMMDGSEVFGEPQTVLHLAHQVNTVMEIAAPAVARHRLIPGSKVRLTNGEQGIFLPDGSRWLMRSTTGAYGFSVSMPLMDEVWAVQQRVVDSMVSPTMVERANPQLVMWSTANDAATPLYPQFRAVAGEEEGALLLEWSPPADDARENPGDRRLWRMASPHWSAQRERMMERQLQKASRRHFIANWLNVWPDVLAVKEAERAMPGWRELGTAPPVSPRGGIVAIDQSRDGTHFGVLRLFGDCVYYDEVTTLEQAVAKASLADHVIVGLTWEQAAVKAGARHALVKYGARNTAAFTALLTQTVRSGRLQHDHHPGMLQQAEGAIVAETEAGKSLSARRSEAADILGPKLLAWALGFEASTASMRPAVW